VCVTSIIKEDAMEIGKGGYFEADFSAKFSMSHKQYQINTKEDAKGVSVSALRSEYIMEFQLEISIKSSGNFSAQSLAEGLEKAKEFLKGVDLSKIGYKGKGLDELSSEEATALVGEDGFFGISATSQRISEFVLVGGGDDLERLKAGREGVMKGFKDAESLWGNTLPDIAYKTLEQALKMIDEKISSLGGQVLDLDA